MHIENHLKTDLKRLSISEVTFKERPVQKHWKVINKRCHYRKHLKKNKQIAICTHINYPPTYIRSNKDKTDESPKIFLRLYSTVPLT